MSIEQKLEEIEREMRNKAAKWREAATVVMDRNLFDISASMLVEASAWDETANSIAAIIKEWEEQRPARVEEVLRKLGEYEVTCCLAGMHKQAPINQEMDRNELHHMIRSLASHPPSCDRLVEALRDIANLEIQHNWCLDNQMQDIAINALAAHEKEQSK